MNKETIPLKSLLKIIELQSSSSVALVGNASSLFNKYQGKEIDSHDCVMRLNYGKVTSPEHQGTRTNLVGCSDHKITLSSIQEAFAPQAVIWLTYETVQDHFFDSSELPFYINEFDHWQQSAHYVEPFLPSSGAIAAYFLRKILNVEKVSIYGFDFFSTPTFYHRRQTPTFYRGSNNSRNRSLWRNLKFWRKKKPSIHSGERELEMMHKLGVKIC